MALQLVSGAYQGKAELAYLCRANGRHVGAHIFGPKLKDTSQISESVKRLLCLALVNADIQGTQDAYTSPQQWACMGN